MEGCVQRVGERAFTGTVAPAHEDTFIIYNLCTKSQTLRVQAVSTHHEPTGAI
jgi:hypothetical protein